MDTFNRNLMMILLDNEDKNFVLSSFSILSVLNVIGHGCSDEIKAEMLMDTLGADFWFMDVINSLTQNLTVRDNGVIKLRNAIFYDKSKCLKDKIKERLQKSTDFKSVSMMDLESTIDIMNKWTEENSQGIMTEVFSKDALRCSINHTYILNSTSFKGKWIKPFKVVEGQFHLNDEDTISCPMLYYEDAYLYVHTTDGGEISVKIPITDDYEFVINTEYNPNRIDYEYKRTDFFMPKFSFDYSWDVNRILFALGFGNWLTSKYDFFDNNQNIRINDIYQKTLFSVSREGVEAASLTVTDCIDGPSRCILINRPYNFYVLNKGICFFSGRCVNPLGDKSA